MTNILEYLERSAQLYPEKPALVDEQQSITFAQALENSRRVGSSLALSLAKGQPVAVYMEKSVENLHFDEAWYAYARFSPMYQDHYGMADGEVKPDDPPIFCSQSTHKLLTAFSQASMLHIKNGGTVKINPVEFNESYMMHGSTSPQYNMIASLDVATKMMDDNGEVMMRDIIREAIQLRKEVARLNREFKAK